MERGPGARDARGWTSAALLAEREAIVAAWEQQVRDGVDALRTAARPIVLDHVNDVLDAVARAVDGEEVTADLETLGASHGIQRVSHGMRLREFVQEHRMLRQAAVDAVARRLAESPPPSGEAPDDEQRRMHRALDVFTAAAVERYAALCADPRAAILERLHLAVAASGLGAWDLDPLLGTFEVDPRTRALLGLPDEERAFGRAEVLERIAPASRAAFEGALAAEGPPTRLAVQVRLPDEHAERWLEVATYALRDDGGAPVRILGTAIDVTARRQLEQTRDRFLAVLGHDLRSPLNAIAMAAHLLHGHRDPAQTDAIIARLVNSVRRMDGLIRDLLDFGRAAVGTPLPVAPRPIELEPICRKVIDEVRAGHPGATIVHEPGGAGHGSWDPARLEQVLVNLLHNALKYGRRGAPVTLRWSVDERTRDLLMEIHNEGEPIPAELIPSLFEPFRTGPGVGSAGTGVGLYVVGQILRAHGGDVRVTSSADGGTTFHLRLPDAG